MWACDEKINQQISHKGKKRLEWESRINMRLNPTETVECGNSNDIGVVPLDSIQSSVQPRSGNIQGLIPVVDSQNNPLMPCKSSVCDRLVKVNKATPFFKKGVFAIRLNKIVNSPILKKIIIAIDPGSKRTGITVATEDDVILNIQCNTPYWVKYKMGARSSYRKSRRYRNTPCRKCRYNRVSNLIPPSTKARWMAHIRIIDQLKKILPITDIVIEDIKAKNKKGSKKWNGSFSPLEVGKKFFESKIKNRNLKLYKYLGYETKEQRDYRGFKKINNKLSNKWEAHCVDSHCLAEMVYGNIKPIKSMYILDFLRFNRRELHRFYRGVRRLYGSTRSEGLNRGTLVRSVDYGLNYIGGSFDKFISLHNIESGKRIYQYAEKNDLTILTKQSWRLNFLSNVKI